MRIDGQVDKQMGMTVHAQHEVIGCQRDACSPQRSDVVHSYAPPPYPNARIVSTSARGLTPRPTAWVGGNGRASCSVPQWTACSSSHRQLGFYTTNQYSKL